MNMEQSQCKQQVGIQKVTRAIPEADEAMNAVLRDILQTREIRQFVIAVVPELLNVWAGRSWFKKTVSKFTGYLLDTQLSYPEDVFGNPELPKLFENEKFIQNLAELIPGIANEIVDAMNSGLASVEQLSPEDKKQFVEDLLVPVLKGRSGNMITNLAKILDDIHTVDSEFLAHVLEPSMTKLLESTDFGEIKQTVDNSVPCALALVRMLNNSIWQYPSKVVGIFSLLPPVLKTVIGSAGISLEKLNGLPPDLLTDIIISLLKETDGQVIAGLINELMEVGRKIYTGSALLGEPGAPQLPKGLAEKLDEIISNIDMTIFWKGRIAFAEIKAMFNNALLEAAGRNPENTAIHTARSTQLMNIRIQTRNRKMVAIEELDDEALGENVEQFLSVLDVQEIAETVNNILRILNRSLEQKSSSVTDFIGRLFNTIDLDELAMAAGNLFEHGGEELRPVARAILPRLITWGCESLQPEDDEFEDDAMRAREALRALLLAEEV